MTNHSHRGNLCAARVIDRMRDARDLHSAAADLGKYYITRTVMWRASVDRYTPRSARRIYRAIEMFRGGKDKKKEDWSFSKRKKTLRRRKKTFVNINIIMKTNSTTTPYRSGYFQTFRYFRSIVRRVIVIFIEHIKCKLYF